MKKIMIIMACLLLALLTLMLASFTIYTYGFAGLLAGILISSIVIALYALISEQPPRLMRRTRKQMIVQPARQPVEQPADHPHLPGNY